MTAEENKSVVPKYVEAFNSEDYETLRRLFTPTRSFTACSDSWKRSHSAKFQ